MLRLTLLLVLAPAISFATIGWRPCPDIAAPLFVNISNCAEVPCLLKRGSNVSWESTFDVKEYSENLTTRAFFHDLTAGVKGEYPLPSSQKNTCSNLNGTRCPLYDGEQVTYTGQMPILLIYPPNVDLDLMMSVENENTRNLTCFQVLARTVN